MRSLLDELAGDEGPVQRVQRAMRRVLPKRFYQEASVAQRGAAFEILLDGQPVKTPAKQPLTLPARTLAEAVAAEWAGQGETIDPGKMPLTRLANVAIDRVAIDPQSVADEIVKYAGSDMLCYRASEPAGLVAAQGAAWDPVLFWARDQLGARLRCVEGVQFVRQPEEALVALRREVAKAQSPFMLAALASVTALTGSALLALALAHARLSADEVWAAAHVDEDWNIGRWGEDAQAMQHRAARRAEFDAAARVLRLSV